MINGALKTVEYVPQLRQVHLRLSMHLVASLLLMAPVANAGYSFTKIADTVSGAPVGMFTSFFSDPSVSGGKVAFQASYNTNGSSRGIFAGSGGPLSTIATTGLVLPVGTISDFGLRSPAISGNTITFLGRYASGSHAGTGIFTGSGGAITTIAASGQSSPTGGSLATYTDFDEPSISGTTVAFNASYTSNTTSGGGEGVFNSTNGVTTTLTTSNADAPARFYTSIFPSAIGNGNTAFFGNFQGTAGDGQGIFKDSGASPTITIAKSGDPAPVGKFTSFWQEPAISGGTVAFVGNYTGGLRGVFTGSGGAVTTIAKQGDTVGSDPLTSFGILTSISGNSVAFLAYNNFSNPNIYISTGGQITPVIRTGDLLFNSKVSSLNIGSFGLDPVDGLSIAFSYTLADGRRGIAIGHPGVTSLPGDFNNNGIVDAADYVVWRSGLGVSYTQSDYAVWRSHFGQKRGSGSVLPTAGRLSAVPEPVSSVLWILVGIPGVLRRRR